MTKRGEGKLGRREEFTWRGMKERSDYTKQARGADSKLRCALLPIYGDGMCERSYCGILH